MNTKLRIAYFIDSIRPGGTELQLLGLIKSILEEGHEVILITLRANELPRSSVPCELLEVSLPKLMSFSSLKTLRRLSRILREKDIGIIHTFFQDATIVGGLIGKIAGISVRVASFRDLGFWLTPNLQRRMALAYRLMTHFTTNADVISRYVTKTFRIDETRVFKMPNGIDTSQFAYRNDDRPVSAIAFIGNFDRPVKRCDLFVSAAALLVESLPKLKFHIFGDGPERAALEAFVENNGMGSNVYFHGRVPNMVVELSRLDIAVNCSDSEGISNTILECMAAGVLNIATDVGGTPEIIQHNETGLLVPPDDARSIANAVAMLCERSDIRNRIRGNARRCVSEKFSWNQVSAEYLQFYNCCIEMNKPSSLGSK